MTTEQDVSKHYTHGSLEKAILDALRSSGKDIDRLTAADLSGADEFHLGWRAATIEFAKNLGLAAGMNVLDIGSGIGGPARYFVEAHACRVVGIDLTQEFVDVAAALTRRCGLGDRAAFQQASALAMPFSDGTFNAASLIHVGMNIADKAKLFAETRRVLKQGARFGVYDIMHMSDAEIPYPMPWAQTPETSFVETPDAYRRLLSRAGFAIESEQNRRDFSRELGRKMRDNATAHGAPPLSLHVLMGPASAERLGNVMKTLEAGVIAPIEMIARAV